MPLHEPHGDSPRGDGSTRTVDRLGPVIGGLEVGVNRLGKPCRIPGVRSTRAIFFRVTEQEYRDLEQVAKENGMKVAETVRHATNEFVADYRERTVFSRTMGAGRTSRLEEGERTACDR